MNAVMLSVRPKWCELLASGQKTIEVRRTKPKLETPFKVYIYQTQGRYADARDCRTFRYWDTRQKVIGEFVCDCVTPLYNVCTDNWDRLRGGMHEIEKQLVGMACMTEAELHNYANGKQCFAWHISELVIYNKPKTLSDFYIPCAKVNCERCSYLFVHNTPESYETWCAVYEKIPIVRPPQSYMYVEER